MRTTGLDLLRRLVARLRKVRALRHERAKAPRSLATYLQPDPTRADSLLAVELRTVMRDDGFSIPDELTLLADGRYLTNSDLERLVGALEEIDEAVSVADWFEESE